jgi:hypothetical protein
MRMTVSLLQFEEQEDAGAFETSWVDSIRILRYVGETCGGVAQQGRFAPVFFQEWVNLLARSET